MKFVFYNFTINTCSFIKRCCPAVTPSASFYMQSMGRHFKFGHGITVLTTFRVHKYGCNLKEEIFL